MFYINSYSTKSIDILCFFALFYLSNILPSLSIKYNLFERDNFFTQENKFILSNDFNTVYNSRYFIESLNGTVIIDCFVFFVVINSFNLGTPNVTFAPPCPAKWKVFNVIYVDGSPKDYAAIAPTGSP